MSSNKVRTVARRKTAPPRLLGQCSYDGVLKCLMASIFFHPRIHILHKMKLRIQWNCQEGSVALRSSTASITITVDYHKYVVIADVED